jgi:hypothetical protein
MVEELPRLEIDRESFPSRDPLFVLPIPDESEAFTEVSPIIKINPSGLDRSLIGSMPSPSRLNKIFTRIRSQVDFLTQTAELMSSRLDFLQKEINELKEENFIE